MTYMSTITHFKLEGLGPLNELQKCMLDNGDILQIRFNTLTPEDGSGKKFLVNYKQGRNEGYIDLSTMKGFFKHD